MRTPPPAFKKPQDPPGEEKGGLDANGRLDATSELMSYFESHDNGWIESFRVQLEEIGFSEAYRCGDPHLYAILKPTREENLQRINNIIIDIDLDGKQYLLRNIRQLGKTK